MVCVCVCIYGTMVHCADRLVCTVHTYMYKKQWHWAQPTHSCIPSLLFSSSLPPPHPLLTYSVFIHSTWGACRDDDTYVLFMPHDQQQFVYEYLINPQLTHQWTQPPPVLGVPRPDATHPDWAGCASPSHLHLLPIPSQASLHPCAIWNAWVRRRVPVWVLVWVPVRLANAKRVERIRIRSYQVDLCIPYSRDCSLHSLHTGLSLVSFVSSLVIDEPL